MTKSQWAAATIATIGGGLYLLPLLLSMFSSGQVRSSSYINTAFDYSPRDESLIFTDDGAGGSDLYLLDNKKKSIRCLAKTTEYEGEPAFSPDGQWIVYSAAVAGEDADHIFIRSLDGKKVRQLTNERRNDKAPTFSPDGSYIVFARNERVTGGFQAPTWSGYCALYRIQVDGTRLTRLTDNHYDIRNPRFTGDGTAIIFAATPEFSETGRQRQRDGVPSSDVFEIDAGSTGAIRKPRQITGDGDIEHVDISPDNKLLLTQSSYGSLRIWERDGTLIRDLGKKITSDLTGYAVKPAFSPNGKHIVFLLRGHGHQSSLWQSDLRGEDVKGISDELLFSDPPNWSSYSG